MLALAINYSVLVSANNQQFVSQCIKRTFNYAFTIVLHWQLTPTQVKCTRNTTNSAYILYGF